MATSLDTLAAVGALVGSLSVQAPDTNEQHADHHLARDALRTAQVELYCGHDAAAMTALLTARRALLTSAQQNGVIITAMEAAAWHIRRHETDHAQTAIQQAQARLA